MAAIGSVQWDGRIHGRTQHEVEFLLQYERRAAGDFVVLLGSTIGRAAASDDWLDEMPAVETVAQALARVPDSPGTSVLTTRDDWAAAKLAGTLISLRHIMELQSDDDGNMTPAREEQATGNLITGYLIGGVVGVMIASNTNEDANKNPKSDFRRQVHDECMAKRGYRTVE